MTTEPSKSALAVAVVANILLIGAAVPFLLTIAGLSIMAFDAPGAHLEWEPYLMVGTVWLTCVAILIASITGVIRMLRRNRPLLSLLCGAIPLIALGLFFLSLEFL